MKKVFVFLLLILATLQSMASDDSVAANLFFIDGTSKNGKAEFINAADAKYIRFKSFENEKLEKILSNDLTKIVYFIGADSVVFDHIKMFSGFTQSKLSGPYWMRLVERGYATLYINQVYLSTPGVNTNGVKTNMGGTAKFVDYYIIRKNEEGAKLISTEATFNSNSVFKHWGVKYFADCPEIAEKIKTKQYTYKDLIGVVREYNAWIISK